MDAVLASVALSGLVVTAVLFAQLARIRREAQARSVARIAALASAAAHADSADEPRDGLSGAGETIEGDAGRGRSDFALAAAPLFTRPSTDDEGPEWRRLAAAAAAPIVIAAAVVLTLAMGREGARPEDPAGNRPAARDPLQLISLDHERRATVLVVSGLVRVPAGFDAAVDAVIQVLDPAGRELARVRTPAEPLEVSPGSAGARSRAFSVSVPDAARAGRYRVRFERGQQVVPHLDRRRAGPLSARR